MEICDKILIPHAPPFKVLSSLEPTRIDRTPMTSYSVFHINCGPISYCFRDNWQYLPNFPTLYI